MVSGSVINGTPFIFIFKRLNDYFYFSKNLIFIFFEKKLNGHGDKGEDDIPHHRNPLPSGIEGMSFIMKVFAL